MIIRHSSRLQLLTWPTVAEKQTWLGNCM